MPQAERVARLDEARADAGIGGMRSLLRSLARSDLPVVFGPGDIAQAHTRDEWIALDEVEQASKILYQFATRV